MILRQPLAQTRRQQQLLLTITRKKVLGHRSPPLDRTLTKSSLPPRTTNPASAGFVRQPQIWGFRRPRSKRSGGVAAKWLHSLPRSVFASIPIEYDAGVRPRFLLLRRLLQALDLQLRERGGTSRCKGCSVPSTMNR